MSLPNNCEVVIVGGGVAGASAAYHLALAGVRDIVVLERGSCGDGSTNPVARLLGEIVEEGDEQSVFAYAKRSGSAVMPSASTIKMMVRLFASSADDFIAHHGEEGARRYLKLTTIGIHTEKELAEQHLPFPEAQLRETGSLYLAYKHDEADLKHEYDVLRRLGCADIEWWSKDKLVSTPGCSPSFHCAIYFPGDGIINSGLFAASLLKATVDMGAVQLFEECPDVTSVSTEHRETADGSVAPAAVTTLANGHKITSKHTVLATGGLFTGDANLSGILRPCWSYLVAMPHPDAHSAVIAPQGTMADGTPHFSHNFFTWGFTHDWCWTNGAVRISGEDHYSALKPPRSAERCASLASWTRRAYPHVFGRDHQQPGQDESGECRAEAPVALDAYARQYGVYSETPDAVPLVGQVSPHSRVCYLLGCNAWGQAVLSYAATLVPGLLGYRELDAQERDLFSLLTIRRFSLLPSMQEGTGN
jgi:glycine/D-amino acid oxidase-like deaminating enzyme